MNPNKGREDDGDAGDGEGRRVPLLEQWWGGFVALFLLAAGVLLLMLNRCAAGECTIAWDAPIVTENVTEHRVYCGLDLLAVVPAPATTATINLPDSACTIAVCAINALGTSTPATLAVDAITVQRSYDLRAWSSQTTIHREKADRVFYRLQIQTP